MNVILVQKGEETAVCPKVAFPTLVKNGFIIQFGHVDHS